MVLVVGQDSPIFQAICAVVNPAAPGGEAGSANAAEGRYAVDPPVLDRAALFSHLLRTKPAAVVVVDGLGRLGSGPAQAELIDLPKVAGAAAGASVRKLVVVTSRASDDAALVWLRRSGMPYVVLRVEAVARLGGAVDRDSLASRKVLVPGDVLAAAENAVGAAEIARAVKDGLGRNDVVGRTIAIEPATERPAVVSVLEQAGARPVVDDSWRSRVTRWLGRPIVQIADDGTLSIGTRRAHARVAKPGAREVAHAL